MIRILVADSTAWTTTGIIGEGGTAIDCVSSDLTYTYAKTTDNAWAISFRATEAMVGRKVGMAILIKWADPSSPNSPSRGYLPIQVLASTKALISPSITDLLSSESPVAQMHPESILVETGDVGKSGVVMFSTAERDNNIIGNKLINATLGIVYEFPCLPAGTFTPSQFSQSTTYHNNMSEGGHFIGRSVVRNSTGVQIQPMSFVATADRLGEVLELLEKMKKNAVYVHHKINEKDFVYYGWTDDDPKVEYTGDEEHITISFSLRCPA